MCAAVRKTDENPARVSEMEQAMTNHPICSKIIQLKLIKPTAAMQEIIERELIREVSGAADYKAFQEFLRETEKNAAILGFNGQRFHISAMRVMLDDNLRLKDEFAKAVIADAVMQAVREQHPERKYIQVDVSWSVGANEEEGYYEHQASIYWNHRRQYEESFCYVRY